MTTEQKTRLLEMRRAGFSFGEIGLQIGVSVNTVKSFCRRNESDSLPVEKSNSTQLKKLSVVNNVCRNCGTAINQYPSQKPKLFCNETCKSAYWRKHRELHHSSVLRKQLCAFCSNPFTCYGSRARKFCSVACSLNARMKTQITKDTEVQV